MKESEIFYRISFYNIFSASLQNWKQTQHKFFNTELQVNVPSELERYPFKPSNAYVNAKVLLGGNMAAGV